MLLAGSGPQLFSGTHYVSSFLVAAPLHMVQAHKKGSLFSQGH